MSYERSEEDKTHTHTNIFIRYKYLYISTLFSFKIVRNHITTTQKYFERQTVAADRKIISILRNKSFNFFVCFEKKSVENFGGKSAQISVLLNPVYTMDMWLKVRL